jgi:undecaprenyl-diphosphatase
MDAFQAFVVGAVQGLTEFIPISSSGHLVLVPKALGWSRPGLAFDVLLHAASLVALLVYFRNDLVSIVRGAVRNEPGARRLGLLLVIGNIPAGLAGFLLADYFEGTFEDAGAAAVQLVITAVILVAAELALTWHEKKQRHLRDLDEMTLADSLAVGIAQAVAIFPGISRSGATIATGIALRVERDAAARFSFLLVIPALAGAALLELPELKDATLTVSSAISGFVASLVFSYLAIAGLIRYLRSNTLYPFAAYCVVAGVVFYLLV